MSIMMCKRCDAVVDTDFEEYDFTLDMCEACSIIMETTKGKSVDDILKGKKNERKGAN